MLLLAACSGPLAPRNAVPFTPPSWYRALYEHDQACSGGKREWAELSWYWVPGTSFSYDGSQDAGLTDGRAGRIYLSQDYLSNPLVIRHEMLHALLRSTPGHPHEFFYVRCLLMWSNYFTSANARAQWVDDSILFQYEQTHGGQLDVPRE